MGIVTRFRHDRRAATAVEYGLFLALIVVAVIGSINLIGSKITNNVLARVSNSLS